VSIDVSFHDDIDSSDAEESNMCDISGIQGPREWGARQAVTSLLKLMSLRSRRSYGVMVAMLAISNVHQYSVPSCNIHNFFFFITQPFPRSPGRSYTTTSSGWSQARFYPPRVLSNQLRKGRNCKLLPLCHISPPCSMQSEPDWPWKVSITGDRTPDTDNH
jgi:hypothetical protein